MRSNRECQVEGHQDCKLSRICLYEKCNLQSRWCCAECVVDKIHLHDQSDDSHIKRQNEFIQQIYQQYQQYNKDIQPELNNILGSVQRLIQQLEKLRYIIIQSNEINFDALIQQATNDFLSLDNQQIEKLITYNRYRIQSNIFDIFDCQNFLENIISELLKFQQLNKGIKNPQNVRICPNNKIFPHVMWIIFIKIIKQNIFLTLIIIPPFIIFLLKWIYLLHMLPPINIQSYLQSIMIIILLLIHYFKNTIQNQNLFFEILSQRQIKDYFNV